MVECSPATRAARVRFPDDARHFFYLFHSHIYWCSFTQCTSTFKGCYLQFFRRSTLYHREVVTFLCKICLVRHLLDIFFNIAVVWAPAPKNNILTLKNKVNGCFCRFFFSARDRQDETIIKKLLRKKRFANGTRCSQAVTHPSTNRAQRCLTSVIGRELVFSTWYGRCRRRGFKFRYKSSFMHLTLGFSLFKLCLSLLKNGH